MRTLVAVVLAVGVLALPALGEGAVNRMDPAKGSFHRIHTKKVKLGCDTCHEPNATDVLLVKKPGSSRVAANREACLGCHQSPAKPAWYGAVK